MPNVDFPWGYLYRKKSHLQISDKVLRAGLETFQKLRGSNPGAGGIISSHTEGIKARAQDLPFHISKAQVVRYDEMRTFRANTVFVLNPTYTALIFSSCCVLPQASPLMNSSLPKAPFLSTCSLAIYQIGLFYLPPTDFVIKRQAIGFLARSDLGLDVFRRRLS